MTPTLQKILYVEDDPDIRTIAMMAFDMGELSVEACASGKQALEKAPQHKPDLILLDVMMPEMDGLETFAHLRKLPETRHTPIIFMTARVQKSEVEKYKSLGAIGIIEKPFDPIELTNAIQQLYQQAIGRMQNE
jgi:two-component system OmpR family response regulator